MWNSINLHPLSSTEWNVPCIPTLPRPHNDQPNSHSTPTEPGMSESCVDPQMRKYRAGPRDTTQAFTSHSLREGPGWCGLRMLWVNKQERSQSKACHWGSRQLAAGQLLQHSLPRKSAGPTRALVNISPAHVSVPALFCLPLQAAIV